MQQLGVGLACAIVHRGGAGCTIVHRGGTGLHNSA